MNSNNHLTYYVEPTTADVAKELNTMMMNPMQYMRNQRYKDAYLLYLAQLVEDEGTKQETPVPSPAPTPVPVITPARSSNSINRQKLREVLRANEEMRLLIEELVAKVTELKAQVNAKKST